MLENNLSIIIKESGLEETKANILLKNFQDYFKIASEWEVKAKSIVISNKEQKAEMQMARAGRLFLREKRLAIEKIRKELKEQSLREGKAIDGIANVLKSLIVPIEEYLDKQEHFIEIKEKEEEEKKRLEEEKKLEEERIAKEKAEREEQERIRIENEKLRKEAEKKEKEMMIRKLELEKLETQRKKAEEEKRKIQEEAEIERKKAEEERIKIEKKAEEEKKRMEEEKREIELKAKKEKIRLEAEKKKIEEEKQSIQNESKEELGNQVECPHCHKRFRLSISNINKS